MNQQRVLITGGYGCIGAATAKWLLANTDAHVVICSRSVNSTRAQHVFHDSDLSRIAFIEADVRDQNRLEQILVDQEITSVAHMAALQTSECNAHRDRGLQVNLAGTQNLIEAMKSSGQEFDRFVFISSVAVYGPRASYPPGRVPMLAEPDPVNVYGAFKLAGELISKFFSQDTGVSVISVRPALLFGPGRNRGLTASPTTAIKCLALDLPFEIPFRSRQDYQSTPDVGAAIGTTIIEPFDGYGVFTLPSHSIDTEEIVNVLRDAADELGIAEQFKISAGDEEVPFICDLDYQPFTEAYPNVPHTSIAQAMHESLQFFLMEVQQGRLTKEDVCQTV